MQRYSATVSMAIFHNSPSDFIDWKQQARAQNYEEIIRQVCGNTKLVVRTVNINDKV